MCIIIILCRFCSIGQKEQIISVRTAVYILGKIPKIALSHGLEFPILPLELCGLFTIGQKLVSPKHRFMNIRSLDRECQQDCMEW